MLGMIACLRFPGIIMMDAYRAVFVRVRTADNSPARNDGFRKQSEQQQDGYHSGNDSGLLAS